MCIRDRHNTIHRCENGQEVLDFLFRLGPGPHRTNDASYLLMLDIRMPKVDGVETLRQIKEDPSLRRLPVIMLTTTDAVSYTHLDVYKRQPPHISRRPSKSSTA